MVIIMNVLNYMEQQRERIRGRHEGDTCMYFKGESAPVFRSAREILAEIDALEGLNLNERINANRTRNFAC